MCIPLPSQMTLAATQPARCRTAVGQVGAVETTTALIQRAAHRNTQATPDSPGSGGRILLDHSRLTSYLQKANKKRKTNSCLQLTGSARHHPPFQGFRYLHAGMVAAAARAPEPAIPDSTSCSVADFREVISRKSLAQDEPCSPL